MRRIPKQFTIGGHTFNVTFITDKEMKAKCKAAGYPEGKRDAYGLFLPDRLQIYIQKPCRTLKRSVVFQSFWHEFAHAMLWVMSDKKGDDEDYVDQLGHHFHQAHQSFKF